MNFGKKEGIVVVGEIQKREIMPLTLELIGAAGKLSKERDLSLSVILSGCSICKTTQLSAPWCSHACRQV